MKYLYNKDCPNKDCGTVDPTRYQVISNQHIGAEITKMMECEHYERMYILYNSD